MDGFYSNGAKRKARTFVPGAPGSPEAGARLAEGAAKAVAANIS